MGRDQRTYSHLCLYVLVLGWTINVLGTTPADSPDLSQPSVATLVQRLEKLVRLLREERQAYYQQQSSLTTRLDQARAATQHWETQLQALTQEETRTNTEARELQRRIEADQKTLTQKGQAEKRMNRRLKDFVEVQMVQIEQDPLPLQTDERLSALRQVIKADPNLPLTAAQGLNPVWQYVEQELTWTQSAQVTTTRITQADGSKPFVRLLRIGHTVLGYLSEDGCTGAWWDGQRAWQSATPPQIETLRGSIAILEGQQVPERMPVPVPWHGREEDL